AFVTGIEITSVRDEVDVHILGYFIDISAPALLAFLAEQRRRRLDRVRLMIARLAAFGVHLDADAILQPAMDDPAKSAGRPWIARALVAGGYVTSSDAAFDRWLERGRPAFVPRVGPTPTEVFEQVHNARGIVSIAHPGLVHRDPWIADFVADGADALEAYHTE